MRGVISAGMALALDELGLVSAFAAVYAASAGAITGAWLLSRPQGLRGWAEPAYARAFIRRSGLLRSSTTGAPEFECQVLHIAETGQRLIAYCAAPGSATEAAFAELAAR